MKIRVVMENGTERVIEVEGTLSIREGESLDVLQDGCVEWWFTKDGHYDGWGHAMTEGKRNSE